MLFLVSKGKPCKLSIPFLAVIYSYQVLVISPNLLPFGLRFVLYLKHLICFVLSCVNLIECFWKVAWYSS